MIFEDSHYPQLAVVDSVQKLRLQSERHLPKICKDLRNYLINSVSFSSGHFASGLGVVELTVALHYVYNTPFDRLIWDTGHQSYPHKILTGRRDKIFTIRKKNGLHSFPCRTENEQDTLSVGHSSTSISAGGGIAFAASRENKKRCTVCVIGDGAITAGIAFEAINHLGSIKPDMLIILNDNGMSISKNIGALASHLKQLIIDKKIHRTIKNHLNYPPNLKKNISAQNLFSVLGFDYTSLEDGHNIFRLVKKLKKIKKMRGPHLLHITTQKGKGYSPAEKDPVSFHAVPRFNHASGILPKKVGTKLPTYSKIFGDWLCEIAKKDKKLVAITPAMGKGSGMLEFAQKYPNQYVDVAIAEQHAVTFSAGLCIGSCRPVVAIYSTFLQRAYDQMIHDIALQKLPILFAVDRAGVVGGDGQTHQGAFDLSFLRCIPGIIIMTPSDENECRQMLFTGYQYKYGPSVVRYPKGQGSGVMLKPLINLNIGKGVVKRFGKKIAILNFGTLLPEAKKVAEILNSTLVDMRFVKPLDHELILQLSAHHAIFVTIEENSVAGGAGSGVNEILMINKRKVSVLNLGLPDRFISQGTQKEVRSELGLDAKGMLLKISSWIKS